MGPLFLGLDEPALPLVSGMLAGLLLLVAGRFRPR
jgi:hypothetical protein